MIVPKILGILGGGTMWSGAVYAAWTDNSFTTAGSLVMTGFLVLVLALISLVIIAGR